MKVYSKYPYRRDFEGAPLGAFEIACATVLYSKFGGASPEKVFEGIPDLCQELKGINIYVIKIALSIYFKKVTREKKPYHPKYFINLAKKLSKSIKNIPKEFKHFEEDFVTNPLEGQKVL